MPREGAIAFEIAPVALLPVYRRVRTASLAQNNPRFPLNLLFPPSLGTSANPKDADFCFKLSFPAFSVAALYFAGAEFIRSEQ